MSILLCPPKRQELLAKFPPGPMETGIYCAQGNLQNFGYFLIGKAMNIF